MSATQPFEVQQQAEDWQRCRPEVLPALFYAYDDDESQTERVVSFQLDRHQLKALKDSVKTDSLGLPAKDFNFVVILGLNRDRQTPEIPADSAFTLYIQAHNKKDDTYDNCFELKWKKNSRFTKKMEDDTGSGANAIPAAGAYLFIYHWLEYPETALATPFTGISPELGKRVKRYIFSKEESKSIYADILSSLSSDAPGFDVHCGVGLAVNDHPFSFRPVVEVHNATKRDDERSHERNATGLVDGDEGSYYDYSYPDPPGTGNGV